MRADEIDTGELFADLQVSLTEIFLVEMLGDGELAEAFKERLRINNGIKDGIEAIMNERFSREEIAGFLRNGFPRRVDLSNAIVAGKE